MEWGGGMSVLVDFAGFLLFVHSQPPNLVYLVKYEISVTLTWLISECNISQLSGWRPLQISADTCKGPVARSNKKRG